MSDDLRARAERLAAVAREYSDEAKAFHARTEAEGKYAGRLCGLAFAAAEFADAVLAASPADSGEPVTAEWLRANGFRRPMQAAAGNWWSSDATVPGYSPGTVIPVAGLEFPGHYRPGVVPVWKLGCYGHYRDSGHCPTRGEVRRLMAALGIPITEPADG